jgi:hypothetical protein
MKVASTIVEDKDDVAVTELLEASEAVHPINRDAIPCWHIDHKSA